MKRFIPLVAAALVATFVIAAPVAAAKPGSGSVTEAITGTVNGVAFAGDVTITRFVVRNGGIVALGTLSGTGTAIDGQQVALPVADIGNSAAGAQVAQITATCEILDLTLGPLDLNLLGLAVHLDTVHLTIDAQQGPGNLLGNLLCAVAGLLDDTGGGGLSGLLNQITALLNQILSILG